MSGVLHKLKLAWRLTEWRAVRLAGQRCPLCKSPVLLRLGSSEHAVRCIRCGANPAAMSLAAVLSETVGDLADRHVYELSSRGPLFRFLERTAGQLTFSEYFDDVAPGEAKNGISCEDVQQLSFGDRSFDVCTSTDVFEHVPDDRRAFAELFRVLKPGGWAVFTVPIKTREVTVERAELLGGEVRHLLPPEFHDDHVRGVGQVLSYRDYGGDIVDRLAGQGFAAAKIVSPGPEVYFGCGRHVVVAQRA